MRKDMFLDCQTAETERTIPIGYLLYCEAYARFHAPPECAMDIWSFLLGHGRET